MPDQKKKKKTLKRVLKLLLTLVILGVVALFVWIDLVPMITANAVTVYDSYTVQTGDISTTKSFSATLSVKKSESFSSSEECTVREIYVNSGDAVKKGDPLVLLSTGDLFSADFDGVVNQIRVEAGDWLWPNFTIVQICDLEHLEVSMNVDEYDVEDLSLNEACTVSVISLGIDFDTVIAHINRVSQSSGTVAFYSVTCDLTVPENVLPGMQATVTMPASSAAGVTTLDMAALAFDEDRNAYVLEKQSDGTYDKVYVQTGLSDGMKVEITSGLNPGDTVYAVAGTESVTSPLTLEDIYKALVGEKVVINDMSAQNGPGGGMPSGSMPSGGTPPTGDIGAMPDANGTTDGQAAADTAATTAEPGASTAEPGATRAPDASADTTAAATSDSAATLPQAAGGGSPPQTGDTSAETTAAPTATSTIQEGGSTHVD